jgi:hypothetical protein
MISQLLIDEINNELGYLDITISSIKELNSLIAENNPNNIQIAAMNQFIAEFYNGIENILKRICKANNIPIPYGEESHINLFNLFVNESEKMLPNIFITEIVDEFKKIRKFRHFVIHGYSFKVDWSYLKESVTKLEQTYLIFKREIYRYIIPSQI